VFENFSPIAYSREFLSTPRNISDCFKGDTPKDEATDLTDNPGSSAHGRACSPLLRDAVAGWPGHLKTRGRTLCDRVSGGFDHHPRAVPDNAFPIARGVARVAQVETLQREASSSGLDQRAADREMAAGVVGADRCFVAGLDCSRRARVMGAGRRVSLVVR
jgi:hypothetical protein